jgi:hypothetical protein
MYHNGELKPVHLMQCQEHHKDVDILHSQIPTKLLEENIGRKNRRRNTKFLSEN